jgi:hypothetical protein
MRRLVLLFGIAVLAAGIWIMVGSMNVGTPSPGFVSDAEVNRGEVGLTSRGEEPGDGDPTEVIDAGLERSEVAPLEATAAPNPGLLRVLVTMKETGEPLPDAEVSYLGGSSFSELSQEEREEYRLLAMDPEALAHRFGTTVLADSEGVAFIPADPYMEVIGRYGEHYGQMTSGEKPDVEREYRLELERDVTLVVQVQDSRGEPAVGVPIGIAAEGGVRTYARATTEAPDGLARVPHMQIRLRGWRELGPNPALVLVRALIPGLIGGGVPFDLENPPGDPVVLRLPPTGRIVVRTTDVNGEGLEPRGRISLAIAPDEPPPNPAIYSPPLGQRWNAQPEEDGTAVFEWVVAGKTYLANVRFSMEPVYEVFPGPLGEDHEVRLTLAQKSATYNIVGRIVSEEREPVRDTQLRLVYRTDRPFRSSGYLQTDNEGRFNVAVGREGGRETTLLLLTIQTNQDAPFAPPTNELASMYIMTGERQLVLGGIDLGEVVLEASALVAAGRVLLDGEVSGRRLFSLRIERAETRQGPERTTERWTVDQNLSVSFLEEGRFEIRGVSRPGRYRLAVENRVIPPDLLPIDPVEFTPGRNDLEIDLDSGGSLQAIVLVDDMFRTRDLRQSPNLLLRLAHTDGRVPVEDRGGFFFLLSDPRNDRLYGHSMAQEGERQTFTWGSLWPGQYRLEVLARGARTPLMTIPDIEIAKGGRSEDTRLDGIDLREKFRRITVQVQDMNGRPIPETSFPTVLINGPTAEDELQGFEVRGGTAMIPTAEPYLDVLVAAQGYRPRTVLGVRTDITVMLEPFPEVVVRIAGGVPPLPPGHALRVSISEKGLQPERRNIISDGRGGGASRWLRPPTVPREIDETGAIELQVSGDGTYSVMFSVRNDVSRRSASIEGIEPAEIQVQESLGRQVFELRISAEGLKKAIEQSGR